MRRVLAIDTSTATGRIAIAAGETVLFASEFTSQRSHNSQIFSPLEAALDCCGRELDLVAVGTGPGSYTGLRIGMSLAKGLAVTEGIPIIPVPTLQVMNKRISREGAYWVLLHSHKNVVFSQRFVSGDPDSPIECEVFDLRKYVHPYGFNLDTICNSSNYVSSAPSSQYVGELAIEFYDKWVESDLNQITPNYVTNFNIRNVPTN